MQAKSLRDGLGHMRLVRLRLPELLLTLVIPGWASAQPGEPTAVQLLWRTAVSSQGAPPTTAPAADQGRLFVVTSAVEAYSIEKGRLLWQVPLRSYVPRNLVARNGMVFVPEATVSALDGETGRKVWEFTPDANASLGRAATDGRTLYFGTSNHRLYALSLSDGRQLWAVDLGTEWKHPAVVRGVAVSNDKVYATVEQWRSPNGHVATGWLIALRAADGKILWRYHTGEGAQRRGLSSSPVVTPKSVVSADYLSNAIVAVDRRNGHELWRFQGEPGFVGFPEAPVVDGHTVFAGSGDTYAYALDLNTGHLLWRTKLRGASESYAMCGQRFLVNEQGLVALDRQTGRIQEMLVHSETEFPTSGFAILDNQAFVAGPKAIYAFVCR